MLLRLPSVSPGHTGVTKASAKSLEDLPREPIEGTVLDLIPVPAPRLLLLLICIPLLLQLLCPHPPLTLGLGEAQAHRKRRVCQKPTSCALVSWGSGLTAINLK